METKIDEVRNELKEEIQIVKMVVKKNSGDIQSLRADIKEIKQKFDNVAEKVERHDEEIIVLKSAVSQT